MPEDQGKPASMQAVIQVVLAYAGFAALWILLSDRLVVWLFRDPDWFALVSTAKGWLFVVVTALLLFGLLRRMVVARPAVPKPAGLATGRRRPGLAFAPLALLIVLTAAFGVAHTLRNHRDTEVARLLGIADLKVEQVSDWLAERGEQAEYVQGDYSITEDYYRWRAAGDPTSGVRLTTRLAQARMHRGFSEVMLLDPDGRLLWSTDADTRALPPELAAAAEKAAHDGKVHRVGPYLDGDGQPHLDFVAAFPPSLGAPPIMVLHTDPADWLYSALQAWPVPSASGETLLLRRDGDSVVFLNQLRYHAAPMLQVPALAEGDRFFANQVLRGDARPGEPVAGEDYRGVAVLGVVRAVAGTDWILATKIDRRELFEQAAPDLLWIGFATLLALAVARFGISMLRSREQLALTQGVRQSQAERLQALGLLAAVADGSQDAIFAKDLEGRYTLCNRAASRLVGKTEDEVVGRDDRTIFPAEAERLMATDRQIVAENRTQVIEETLSTTAGARVFLTTKSPLCDAGGKVVGIFGIARDITERQQAEAALRESESRFRALVEQTVAGIYIIQDGVFRYVNQGFATIFGYGSPKAVIGKLTVARFVAPEDFALVQGNIKAREEGSLSEAHYGFTALSKDGERVEVEVHGRGFEYLGRRAVIGLIQDISARKAAEEAQRRQAAELARRNAELERFNEAMVGRELVMVALKQQVNTLSLALGREPPFQQPAADAGEKSHSAGEPA